MFAISAAMADEASVSPVTEYENSARLLISLLDEPYAACATPDGNLLATGHDDGLIVFWNIDTGLPVRSLTGHSDTVSSLTFDATGSRVASGSYDGAVRVWSMEGGEEIVVLSGHTGRVTTVAFSPDGDRLASGGYDKTVRVWNLRQPEAEPVVLSGHEATVRSVAFSPDGERLATGDAIGTLRLWDVSSTSEVERVDAHTGPVRALLFAPGGPAGGLLLSGGDDGAVMQWNADTLEQQQALSDGGSRPLHSVPVTCMALSPDGRLLATGDQSGHVQTWDFVVNQITSRLDGHEDEICGLSFRSGATALVTASRDRTVNVWRSKLPVTPRLATIDDVDVRMWSLAIAPDHDTLLAGGRDSFLAGWDLESGRQTMRYEGFDGTVDSVAVTADGTHIACCGWREENVAVFDARTGEKTADMGVGVKVRCVQFSPDGEWLVAGGEDGALRIWRWRTGGEPQVVPTGALAVYDVAFSPDGRQLVTCSGNWRTPDPGDVTFWNTDAWSEVVRQGGHAKAVRSVTFNSDGTRVASAGENGLVILWHAETHVPLARLQNGAGVRPVAFSPDGTRLAVGLHDGTINVWDSDRGEVVQRFQTEDDVFGVAYSRDGSVLFSVSGEKRVEIWPTGDDTTGTDTTAAQIAGWTPRTDEKREQSE